MMAANDNAIPDERIALVKASILEAAQRAGVAPEDISRGQWRRHKPPGPPSGHDIYALGATWEDAREAALAFEIPEGYEPPWRVPMVPIPNGHSVKGVSTLVDSKGNTVAQWVKTRADGVDPVQLVQDMLDEMPDRMAARAEPIPPPAIQAPDDLLAVYPLGDPHVGMLAWGKETGDADFNLEIADRLMRGAIMELAKRQPRTKRALIVNLGDYFHADDLTSQTSTAGGRRSWASASTSRPSSSRRRRAITRSSTSSRSRATTTPTPA